MGYVVGTPGCHDISQAQQAAAILGLPLRVVGLDEAWVELHLPKLMNIVPDVRVTAFELPLYGVAMAVREKVLITGQGADELFGGYQRYLRVPQEELVEVLAKDIRGVLGVGRPREERLVASTGHELRCPYLHVRVLEVALALPGQRRVRDGTRKVALREAAQRLGLPAALAQQPKKAVQYGSGTAALLRRMARARGEDVAAMLGRLSIRGDNDPGTIL